MTAAATEMSPEVAADAAEPPGVVAHAAVFPKVTPAAVSPEVAADAAEPPEAAVLSLAPCMVVAPNNSCPVCHITVEGTVDKHCTCPVNKLYLFPDFTTVEPPDLAASAAEPSEVSVVITHESSSWPCHAMDAIYESSSCPVTAMDAV